MSRQSRVHVVQIAQRFNGHLLRSSAILLTATASANNPLIEPSARVASQRSLKTRGSSLKLNVPRTAQYDDVFSVFDVRRI
jgi:hypothetical protein